MKNKKNTISWRNIHTIVFDFDGVFTDNKVYTNQDGKESVCCDRGDGLGFDILRNFKKINKWNVDYYILSKERNNVVKERALKLNIPVIQAENNKINQVKNFLNSKKKSQSGLLYIGNDLNDLEVMCFSKYSFAPSDAHEVIKRNATHVFNNRGGNGFVREVIEYILEIDNMETCQLIQLMREI